MARRGLRMDGGLIVEAMAARSGGRSRGTALLALVELAAEADAGAFGVRGEGRARLHLQGTLGEEPSTFVRDYQVTSNIEAPSSLWVYEAWYEHRWREGRLGLLAGIHDYNREFDVLERAALFVNSSFGIQPEISQVPPSIFPATAAALRLDARWPSGAYLLAAAYDGTPRMPEASLREQFRVTDGGGVLYALEAGVENGSRHDGSPATLAGGVWALDGSVEDPLGAPRSGNGGAYLIAERRLAGGPSGSRSLGGFLQAGGARSDRNRVARYLGAGLVLEGPFSGREEDRLGLALARAVNSDASRKAAARLARSETVLELTYAADLGRGAWIQPDLQLVLDPGEDPETRSVWVLTLRLGWYF